MNGAILTTGVFSGIILMFSYMAWDLFDLADDLGEE